MGIDLRTLRHVLTTDGLGGLHAKVAAERDPATPDPLVAYATKRAAALDEQRTVQTGLRALRALRFTR